MPSCISRTGSDGGPVNPKTRRETAAWMSPTVVVVAARPRPAIDAGAVASVRAGLLTGTSCTAQPPVARSGRRVARLRRSIGALHVANDTGHHRRAERDQRGRQHEQPAHVYVGSLAERVAAGDQ